MRALSPHCVFFSSFHQHCCDKILLRCPAKLLPSLLLACSIRTEIPSFDANNLCRLCFTPDARLVWAHLDSPPHLVMSEARVLSVRFDSVGPSSLVPGVVVRPCLPLFLSHMQAGSNDGHAIRRFLCCFSSLQFCIHYMLPLFFSEPGGIHPSLSMSSLFPWCTR